MCKLISVVLVNFNNTIDTIDCVESLVNSTGVELFIVVVDNKSDDKRDFKIIKQFGDNIHIIQNEINVGFGRANNIGIKWINKNISSDYILLLNNDTVVEPDSISLLVNAYVENDCSVVVPKILYADNPSKIWYAGGEIDWKLGRAKSFGLNSENVGYDKSCFVSFASGCALLTKSALFEEVGFFDERMFMYLEDVDLSMRIISGGHKIFFQPQAIVYHKVQGSQRSRDSKYISGWSPKNPKLEFHLYHGVKNSIIAMRNNASRLVFYRYAILYSLFLFYKFVFFTLNGRQSTFSIIIKAIKDSMK